MICPFQTEGKRLLEASPLLCFGAESLFRQVITLRHTQHFLFSIPFISYWNQRENYMDYHKIINDLQPWSYFMMQVLPLTDWSVSALELQTLIEGYYPPLCCLSASALLTSAFHFRRIQLFLCLLRAGVICVSLKTTSKCSCFSTASLCTAWCPHLWVTLIILSQCHISSLVLLRCHVLTRLAGNKKLAEGHFSFSITVLLEYGMWVAVHHRVT